MTNLAPHPTFDLFDQLLQNLMQRPHGTPARVQSRQQFPRMIAVDVLDTAEQYKILANLPGVSREDIELTIEGSRVTLATTTKPAHEQPESAVRWLAAERFAGKWQRALELPEEIDDEKVSATLKDGVLELVLPKKTPRGVRRVEIA